MSTVTQAEIEALLTWIREPDHVEVFGFFAAIDWMERRPLATVIKLASPEPKQDRSSSLNPRDQVTGEANRVSRAVETSALNHSEDALKVADALHQFIAAVPHEYPGHNVALFESAEASIRSLVAEASTLDTMAEVGFSMTMDKGAEIERLRGGLEQIRTTCIDNVGDTVRHDLALKFVGHVAETFLATPPVMGRECQGG